MTIVVQFNIDGNQSELDKVLTAFDEDDLIFVSDSNPPSPTDGWEGEVRTNEGEVLSRFHQACLDWGIVLDVQRIRHDQVGSEKRGDDPVNIDVA